jgi:hypothetical protein
VIALPSAEIIRNIASRPKIQPGPSFMPLKMPLQTMPATNSAAAQASR